MSEHITITAVFGTVEIQSKYRLDGERLIGMSRKLCRDMDGNLTETGEWTDTGVTLGYAAIPRWRAWWGRNRRRQELVELARSCGAEVDE